MVKYVIYSVQYNIGCTLYPDNDKGFHNLRQD